MSRKFTERVQAERAALRCVNGVFVGNKLHGLAPRAIAAWDQHVDWNSVPWDRGQILNQLLQIGHCCQALADQSRGAFDANTFDARQVEHQIEALKEIVAGQSDEGSPTGNSK